VRNQTIINLYDRPLYPRPSYSSRHLNPIEYPRPILSYLVVTGALLYCAIYLVSGLCERRPVRLETAAAKLERADAVPILRAPEAPAPDMSSEDVRFAAADVNRADEDRRQSTSEEEGSHRRKAKRTGWLASLCLQLRRPSNS
jgi:hypothetical protein